MSRSEIHEREIVHSPGMFRELMAAASVAENMERRSLEHEISLALSQAIATSDDKQVQRIVSDQKYDVREPLDVASSRKGDHIPPLHFACIQTENLKIFKTLLNAPGGRQVLNRQSANCQSSSPLILAAKWNRLNVIKYLLNEGADATLRDDDGWTAFDYSNQSQYDYVRLNVSGLIKKAENELHEKAENIFLGILDEEELALAKAVLLEEKEQEKKRLKKLEIFGDDRMV